MWRGGAQPDAGGDVAGGRPAGVGMDRVSFIGAPRWLRGAEEGEAMPESVVNPSRPGRSEPRRKERPLTPFDLMRCRGPNCASGCKIKTWRIERIGARDVESVPHSIERNREVIAINSDDSIMCLLPTRCNETATE